MSDYRGESWPKKVARALLWWRVQRLLGGVVGMSKANVLVLSGPDAGDVACAVSYGASASRIVAVDVDREHLASASAVVQRRDRDAAPLGGLGGLPRLLHSDVASLPMSYRRSFDVVFLDFCCTAPKAIPVLVKTAAKYAKEGALVGLGFMYGRDGGSKQLASTLREMRSEDFQARVDSAERLIAAFGYRTDPSARDSVSAAARYCFAADLIMSESERMGFGCAMGLGSVEYVSSDGEHGKGVPMLYMLGRKTRRGGVRALAMAVAEGIKDNSSAAVRSGDAKRLVRESCVVTNSEMPASILACMYSIEPAQIAAWRAVATREARASAAQESA